MYTFIISQLIGLCLFFTLNYGVLSYINYRKNQAVGKPEKRIEWLFLQHARVGMTFFFVGGLLYRISAISQELNVDYSALIFQVLFSTQSFAGLAL